MSEPEIHHIGHPSHRDMTWCGIPMPPEQAEVRTRAAVRICSECARRFKAERLSRPDRKPSQG